jgi:1-phosphofructokinase
MRDNESTSGGTVCVFAPSPLLTVTVEALGEDRSDVHIHAGGQGPWIANMLTVLHTRAILCGPFGGETGQVLRALLDADEIDVRAVDTLGPSGCYVEDRRSGELACVAEMAPVELNRHEVDDLCNEVLAAGLEAGVAVLTGPSAGMTVPADVYRRTTADLAALGVQVVADLSGEPLTAALEGGLAVLKVSDEDLVQDGRAGSGDLADLTAVARQLHKQVSDLVVITRGGEPALALLKDRLVEVHVPRLQTVHHRGAGDAMTAGIAAALRRGSDLETALRLGAAAGVVNVTRHGLASGHPGTIEQIADRVEIRPAADDEGGSS